MVDRTYCFLHNTCFSVDTQMGAAPSSPAPPHPYSTPKYSPPTPDQRVYRAPPVGTNQVSVSSAEECANCSLRFKNGMSTSSAQLRLSQYVLDRTANPVSKTLTVYLSLPFEFSFNGQIIGVNSFQLVHPSPIRIEGIQHDAAILMVGENGNFVLAIPIEASSNPDQKTDSYVRRITSFFPQFLQPNKDGNVQNLDISTGSDWNISNILPLTGDQGGQLAVQEPYFYWISYPDPSLAAYVKSYPQGKPLPNVGQTAVIAFAKPITIGGTAMSAINLLDTTPAQPGIVGSKILYKPYICSSSKPKREHFCNPFDVPPTPPPFTSETLITIIISVIGAIAGFIGVYFAVKYAAGPAGDVLKKFAESVGRGLAKVRISAPQPKNNVESIEKEQQKKSEKSLLPVASKEFEDKAKEGETFAFKNPMQQKKTQRKIPSDEQTIADLFGDKSEKQLNKALSEQNPIQRKKTPSNDKAEKVQWKENPLAKKKLPTDEQTIADLFGDKSEKELNKALSQQNPIQRRTTQRRIPPPKLPPRLPTLTSDQKKQADDALKELERRQKEREEAIKENEELDKKMQEKLKVLHSHIDKNRPAPEVPPTKQQVEASTRRQAIQKWRDTGKVPTGWRFKFDSEGEPESVNRVNLEGGQ
jgi:hypothetical protein